MTGKLQAEYEHSAPYEREEKTDSLFEKLLEGSVREKRDSEHVDCDNPICSCKPHNDRIKYIIGRMECATGGSCGRQNMVSLERIECFADLNFIPGANAGLYSTVLTVTTRESGRNVRVRCACGSSKCGLGPFFVTPEPCEWLDRNLFAGPSKCPVHS